MSNTPVPANATGLLAATILSFPPLASAAVLFDYEVSTTAADLALIASVHAWTEKTVRDITESPLAYALSDGDTDEIRRAMDVIGDAHAATYPSVHQVRAALLRAGALMSVRKRAIDRVLDAGRMC